MHEDGFADGSLALWGEAMGEIISANRGFDAPEEGTSADIFAMRWTFQSQGGINCGSFAVTFVFEAGERWYMGRVAKHRGDADRHEAEGRHLLQIRDGPLSGAPNTCQVIQVGLISKENLGEDAPRAVRTRYGGEHKGALNSCMIFPIAGSDLATIFSCADFDRDSILIRCHPRPVCWPCSPCVR